MVKDGDPRYLLTWMDTLETLTKKESMYLGKLLI